MEILPLKFLLFIVKYLESLIHEISPDIVVIVQIV